MLMTTMLIAAIAVVVVGSIVLWANSARWINRLVFSCSIHIALWLAFIHAASSTVEGLYWLRWATSISALIPLHFWFVKQSIVSDFEGPFLGLLKRASVWSVPALVLALVPFTEYFIPSYSTSTNRVYGPAYYMYIVGVFGLYGALAIDTTRNMRVLTGGRRLALQVWLWGGCAAAATILLLMMINAVTRSYIRMQPFVVLVYYAATAFAITTHRIFDARQLLLMAFGRAILVAFVALTAYFLYEILSGVLPSFVAFFTTTGVALGVSRKLSRSLGRMLNFFPEGAAARQAAFSAAQRESKADALESAFISVLKGWGSSERSVILSGANGVLSCSSALEVVETGPVVKALRQLKWATPERLNRERLTPEKNALASFMSAHELGVTVFEEGPAMKVLIGVGYGASRRPFTYPQVLQLMELASIMESSLERAHFSAKVQHAEQLATVGLLGASLAHEIRNPLVSIKTFVQLLPTHYQDPVFREKFFRLIGDEVGRIDQLTEQLLDLASPRTYAAEVVELHPLLRASVELVAAKAGHRNVQLLTDFGASPDSAFTDASAAKQVMLNLCFNAIQAVENHSVGDKWVRIATRNTGQGIEMLVADSGPGISEEIRPRLFQPFQTTKSTGFGLGLAICSDILTNLNATISVDPSEPGRGATFRVIFPCQPLSS